MNRSALLPLCLVLALAGCTHTDTPTEAGASSLRPLNQSVTLAPGQEVSIGGGFYLRCDRVHDDSRCPRGAQCVWEGDVSVDVVVRTENVSFRFTLTAHAPRVSVLGFGLTLHEVTPAPVLGQTISPSDYRAVIEVGATP
jgi:hypothetical protein